MIQEHKILPQILLVEVSTSIALAGLAFPRTRAPAARNSQVHKVGHNYLGHHSPLELLHMEPVCSMLCREQWSMNWAEGWELFPTHAL